MLILLLSCQEKQAGFSTSSSAEQHVAEDCSNGLYFSPVDISGLSPREMSHSFHDEGPSVAIFDLDHDGMDDIIQCFPDEKAYHYTSSGKSEISIPCGTMLVEDFNHDGWQDLVVEQQDLATKKQSWFYVYQNNQGTLDLRSRFVSFTKASAIRSGDIDQDGLIDIALFGLGDNELQDQNLIIWGKENWTFELRDNSYLKGGKTFDGILADFNQDGLLDIYSVNDQGYVFEPNVFWWNRGDFLEEDTSCQCYPTQNGMGVNAGDYNRDGFLDLIASDVDQTHLLSYFGDEIFIDMTLATGANTLHELDMGWGIQLVDIDNDGFLEILSALGDQTYSDMSVEPEFVGDMQISLGLQIDGEFTEAREQFGFTSWGSFRSIVPIHWNDDGILDYWITEAEKAPRLMVSNGCSENSWLTFTGPNHTAVKLTADDQVWYGELSNASSYGASRSSSWHVGLGDQKNISKIEVRFPGENWKLYAEKLDVNQKISLEP